MRRIVTLSLLTCLLINFSSCQGDESSDSKGKNLPPARGENSEIVLVMDSSQWRGDLGKQLRAVFHAEIDGLPQPEQMFTLRKISPNKMNDFLRMASNLLIVHTLDNNTAEGRLMRKNYFTENSLKTIQSNENIFSNVRQDMYAKNQEVLYLFGQTEAQLIEKLEKNKTNLQKHFLEIENKRIAEKIGKKPEKGLMNELNRKFSMRMTIPFGYEMAHQKDNFVWLRQLDKDYEKNIWITKVPYENEDQFKEINILPLRDSLAKKNIYDVEKPSMHLASQNQEPFYFDYLDMDENYAVEIRGLWKYSDNSRGGAFIGYLILNESENILYYIEGYLDAPGKDKRDGIRELESTLRSVKFGKKE